MKQKSYTITDLVVIFLAFTALQLIIGIIAHQLLAVYNLTWLQPSIVTCVSFSLLIYWQLTTQGLTITSYFTSLSFSLLPVMGLLLAGSGLSIILSEVNNIMHCFWPLSKTTVNQINNLIVTKTNGFWLGFPLVIITAGLQEFFLRGLILQGLLTNYSLKKAAGLTILLQLILNFNFYHLVGIFTLSLLLNWLYLHSKSLLLCMLGNIFYSGLPYLLLHYLPIRISGYNTKLTTTAQFQPLWFNLLGILLLGGGSIIIINYLSGSTSTLD